MKKLLVFLSCIIFSLPVFASHLEGAEIRYEFNGTNYTIYLDNYASCGGIPSPSTQSISITGPSSYSALVTAVLTGVDTLNPYCPSVVTKCQNSSSTIPGYTVHHYMVTVALPSTTGTYKFSCSQSARNTATNIGSGNLYVEATINTASGINSSAWLQNSTAIFLPTGATTTTALPVPASDNEGDSLVYTMYQPLDGPNAGPGSPISYTAPNTLSSPMGSGSICSLVNRTLYLKSSVAGQHQLAIRISDYRNGVLVGTMTRDFRVYVLPGSAGYSIPSPTSSLLSTTCPGASNSVTITCTDPVSTDSVYVDVTPPTLSGFTFTVTTAPGIGSGSSTITWTSPGSLNPATLTHFYFNATARDNACPNKGTVKFAHMVITGPCASDSVWPGDANGDKTVNIYDPLAIAIAAGKTGSSRTGATTSWTPQACTNWSTSFMSGVNHKHADCDGNGTVASIDVNAVTANWGNSHPKPGIEINPNKTTGLPNLGFDHTGIKFIPGTTVTVPLKLGDAASPMNNIYGLCGTILIEGVTLSSGPNFNYTASWLGSSGSTLNFIHRDNTNSTQWAYARTTGSNISGNGTLASITFTVPSSATIGGKIILKINSQKIIDKDGADVGGFNVIYDTATIESASVGITNNNIIQFANVIPNPSAGNAVLYLATSSNTKLNIRVTDMMGKTVWHSEEDMNAGSHSIELPSTQLAAGAYIIRIENDTRNSLSNIKWMKQ